MKVRKWTKVISGLSLRIDYLSKYYKEPHTLKSQVHGENDIWQKVITYKSKCFLLYERINWSVGSMKREDNGKNKRSSQTGRNTPERSCCQWECTAPDRQLFFDLLAEALNKHSEIPHRTLCISQLWLQWPVYFYHQEPFQGSDSKNHSEWDSFPPRL